MSEFTVVLLRPEYLCELTDEKYGNDIYIAYVEAEGAIQAYAAAQKEVYLADTKEGLLPASWADYKLCVLFKGHADVSLFGWQV